MTIDSGTIVGAERAALLLAISRCRHAQRKGYRNVLLGLIGSHKDFAHAAYWPGNADMLDLLRFIYRSQLAWPTGLFEPPISRLYGKPMGVTILHIVGDVTYGITDRHGDPLWRNWDGRLSKPYEKQEAA